MPWIVIIPLLVIGGFASIFYYFMGTETGIRGIHALTVKTIVMVVKAKQWTNPTCPLWQIYMATAQGRAKIRPSLRRLNYIERLREHGCFNSPSTMSPEEFAQVAVDIEGEIKRFCSWPMGR